MFVDDIKTAIHHERERCAALVNEALGAVTIDDDIPQQFVVAAEVLFTLRDGILKGDV